VNLKGLEQSLDHVALRGDELVDVFYFRLFARAPEVVRLLLRADPKLVRAMLLGGLVVLRQSLPTLDSSIPRFRALGALLHEHGLEPKHYPVVGEVLIASIAEVVGDAWRPELEDAWSDVFVVVAGAMIDGVKEALRPAAA
jgi:hemoglobin-like flavoprotein